MKRIISLLLFSFTFLPAHSQGGASQEKEQLTGIEAGGKIYIVMVVVILVVTGLLLYLWRLDRKISRMEKQKN